MYTYISLLLGVELFEIMPKSGLAGLYGIFNIVFGEASEIISKMAL